MCGLILCDSKFKSASGLTACTLERYKKFDVLTIIVHQAVAVPGSAKHPIPL